MYYNYHNYNQCYFPKCVWWMTGSSVVDAVVVGLFLSTDCSFELYSDSYIS